MSTINRKAPVATQKSSGAGKNVPTQNIAIKVSSYHLADASGKTKNLDEDYLKGFLLAPIKDPSGNIIEPTFDYIKQEEDGSFVKVSSSEEFDQKIPTLEVIVKMPKIEGQRQYDIATLANQKKGLATKKEKGSIVVFDNSKIVSTNPLEISASYASAGPDVDARGVTGVDPETGAEIIDQESITGVFYSDVYISVLPQRMSKGEDGNLRPWKDRKGNPRQDVLVAFPESSAEISNVEELKSLVTQINEATFIGSPGFSLLARQIAPETMTAEEKIAFAREDVTRLGGYVINSGSMVDGKWVPMTTDQLVDKFFENNPSIKDVFGEKDWMFEVCPVMSVGQGKTLIPSIQAEEIKAGTSKKILVNDRSVLCALYSEQEEGVYLSGVVTTEDGKKIGRVVNFDMQSGWIRGHVEFNRVGTGPLEGQNGLWYSTSQTASERGGQVLLVDDLITPNTPDYHVVAAKEVAEKLGKTKGLYYSTVKKQKADPEVSTGPKL